MAFTITDRGTTNSGSPAGTISTVTSGSFTPAANSLIIALFGSVCGPDVAPFFSVSGTHSGGYTKPAGGTGWVELEYMINPVNFNAWFDAVCIFFGQVGASPGAGTVTVSISDGITTAERWLSLSILEVSGHDNYDYDNYDTAWGDDNAASISTILPIAPLSGSLLVGLCIDDGNNVLTEPVQPTGWTLVERVVNPYGGGGELVAAYMNGSGNQTSSWTGLIDDATNEKIAIALEIYLDGTAPTAEEYLFAVPPALLTRR